MVLLKRDCKRGGLGAGAGVIYDTTQDHTTHYTSSMCMYVLDQHSRACMSLTNTLGAITLVLPGAQWTFGRPSMTEDGMAGKRVDTNGEVTMSDCLGLSHLARRLIGRSVGTFVPAQCMCMCMCLYMAMLTYACTYAQQQ